MDLEIGEKIKMNIINKFMDYFCPQSDPMQKSFDNIVKEIKEKPLESPTPNNSPELKKKEEWPNIHFGD